MSTKRAKIINPTQFQMVLSYVSANSERPESDRLKLLLSYRAALRVCEIVGLTMDAVTTADGKIAKTIQIFSHATKNGRERSIPMHPEIADAIKAFRRRYPEARKFAVGRDGKYQTVNNVTVWFHNLYKKVGLYGCSSHSGRRTCLTQLARRVESCGGSLRDVQAIAGHARLDTTQHYIEPSTRTRDMILTLGDPRFEAADFDDFEERAERTQITGAMMALPIRKAPKRRTR